MVAIVTTQTWLEAIVVWMAIIGVLLTVPTANIGVIKTRLRPFYYFAFISILFGGLSAHDPLIIVGPLTWGKPALEKACIAAIRLVALGTVVSWFALHVNTATMVATLTRI